MSAPLRVLVAGLGNMGRSHALAYHRHPGFEIVGLVNRSTPRLHEELAGYDDPARLRAGAARAEARRRLDQHLFRQPRRLCGRRRSKQGAHVFVEKPLATTVADAERVVAAAKANGRKLVVGYILRHHPSWMRLIAEARKLGGPYVFRMNLNQQSSGPTWETHKQLMETTLADRRLRRALCRRDVPDHRRQGRSRCAAWACGSATRSRPTCTITATSRCCSTTARSAWYEAALGADDFGHRRSSSKTS